MSRDGLQPIETRYAGHRFRSRLEARWAVAFDTLGVRWQYEPEGFALPTGSYLPDFLLTGVRGIADPGGRLWFEVKPDNGAVDSRWSDLVRQSEIPMLIAFGQPDPTKELLLNDLAPHGARMMALYPNGREEHPVAFTVCDRCGRIGAALEGRAGRVCRHDDEEHHVYNHDHPRVLAAYIAARSARFEREHEKPSERRTRYPEPPRPQPVHAGSEAERTAAAESARQVRMHLAKFGAHMSPAARAKHEARAERNERIARGVG